MKKKAAHRQNESSRLLVILSESRRIRRVVNETIHSDPSRHGCGSIVSSGGSKTSVPFRWPFALREEGDMRGKSFRMLLMSAFYGQKVSS